MDDGRSFGDRLGFLRELDAGLASDLLRAAQLAHDDRLAALVYLRAFCEAVVRKHLMAGVKRDNGKTATVHELLEKARSIEVAPSNIQQQLDLLRTAGNHGVHPESCPDVPESTVDLVKAAWSVGVWLHLRAGGTQADVPSFIPPTAADGNSVFRDAVLGGPAGMGDPVAKFHVGKAILAQRDAMFQSLREGELLCCPDRRQEAADLMRASMHEVPTARSEYAKLLQQLTKSPTADQVADQVALLEWAAEAEDPEGLFLLGWYHADGLHGKPVDPTLAVEFWERAVAKEDPRAFNALAFMYRDGTGVEQDSQRAREYARRSAEAGFALGQNLYGWFLLTGEGGTADSEAGLVWIRRAVRQRWHEAMFQLAMLLMDHDAEPEPGESAEALLSDACSGGSAAALIWRATRELTKDNSVADFGKALNDLAFAQKSPQKEKAATARSMLAEAHRRLEAYLLPMPRLNPRREKLAAVWFSYSADGQPKFDNLWEHPSKLVPMETGPDGTMRMTEEAILNVLRMRVGPGLTQLEEAAYLAEVHRQLGPPDGRPIMITKHRIPGVGRNDPCPCASGSKYKKCCGK